MIDAEHRPVILRHVKRVSSGTADATTIVGQLFKPDAVEGLNGRGGWVSGEVELRILEEGGFSLVLPNGVGADHVAHVQRFLCLTDPSYAPGDEWIEVYEGEPGLSPPLFVGTPTEPIIRSGRIELRGFDLLELFKTEHDPTAGFWRHAPRDVFEHATGIWEPTLVEPFTRQDFVYAQFDLETTPDGAWEYQALRSLAPALGEAEFYFPDGPEVGSQAGLLNPQGANGDLPLIPVAPFGPGNDWRVELVFTVNQEFLTFVAGAGSSLGVGLAASSLAGASWGIQVANGLYHLVARSSHGTIGGNVAESDYEWWDEDIEADLKAPGPFALALEARDRWLLFYFNGELKTVLPRPLKVELVGGQPPPGQFYLNAGGYNGAAAQLRSLLIRRWRPLAMRNRPVNNPPGTLRRGDYRLPGIPQPGGLVGSYFDDRNVPVGQQAGAASPQNRRLYRALAPGRDPVARRLDTVIGLPAGAMPAGVAAEDFSVRWTGAIYLNFAAAGGDIYLRAAGFADAVRVWVGRTFFGEQIIDDWHIGTEGRDATSAGLRGPLEASATDAGWYPIVIELMQGAGLFGMSLQWCGQSAGVPNGLWAIVGADSLSPQGIFEQYVRGSSSYELMQDVGRTFGLQYRVEPEALESGRFPGAIVPRIRVGRDTDKVVTEPEGGDVERRIDTRSTVQALLLEAAGIAREGAQLTIEQLDFDELGQHLFLHSDSISLSDVTIPEVLAVRGQTLQTLRRTANEEVGFRPRGSTELRDSFPLVGALSRFAWEPGDGVRLSFPSVALEDVTPRRITAVTRPITPASLGPPAVSLRARPRGVKRALRELARSFTSTQRQYQGQLTTLPGTPARVPTAAYMPDASSRVPFPVAGAIVEAWLVVETKTDGSEWEVLVNGIRTARTFRTPGRVNVLPWAKRDGANPRLYATVDGSLSGGTGAQEFALELVVRI